MKCPLPKWFRYKCVSECKPMQVGLNDESAKQAALTLVERHYKFGAPFEKLELTYHNIERGKENIGSYKITVERMEENGMDNNSQDSGSTPDKIL